MPIPTFAKRLQWVLLAAGLIAFFPSVNLSPAHAAPNASTRYVATTGIDTGACMVSGSPCATIQYAVNQSVSGDTILVAMGTYYFSTDACAFNQTHSVVCFLNEDLRILGGYTTSNWNFPDPSANVTTIDGQSQYRGVMVYGGPTASLDMEGFTIQNCKVVGPTTTNGGDPTGYGGGMWILSAYVTLRNVKFINNQAVGQSNPSSGVGGTAAGSGLAINSGTVQTTSFLQGVTFDSNQSSGGVGSVRGGVAYGALYMVGSNVSVQDSIFTNNIAVAGNSSGVGLDSSGNQAYALGAGIAFERDPNSPTPASLNLTRLTVTGNRGTGGNAGTASGDIGGGAHGGILVESGTSVSISDSFVSNNSAISGNGFNGGYSFGGGISILDTPATIDRTFVISNSVLGGNSTGGGTAGGIGGGGVFVYRGVTTAIPTTLTNVIIANNSAASGSTGTNPGGGGGGIQIQGLTATLTHVTLAQNSLGTNNLLTGQAIIALANSNNAPANVTMNNGIIANHASGPAGASAVSVMPGSTLTFSYGLFAGNTINIGGSGTLNGLATMQSAASAGFVSPGAPNYNYHIRLDSPAKDKATGTLLTTIDIDKQGRPYNTYADFGADEYWPFSLSAAPGNGLVQLNWSSGVAPFVGGVNHYDVVVLCSPGAHAPNQGACGQPISAGTQTSFGLTGLTNSAPYTVTVYARDLSDVSLASSNTLVTVPVSTTTTSSVYLPLVVR